VDILKSYQKIKVIQMKPKKMYSQKFFKDLNNWSLRSAREIVHLVIKLTKPKSVVDLGCGNGNWLLVFKEKGIKDLLGVDKNWAKEDYKLNKEKFLNHDLRKPLFLKRKFDLAICLETAEHLEEKYAETLINSLTNLSDIILFSAAIPFQRGNYHVNLQWPEYWIKLFHKKDYVPIDCIRKKIWNNEKVDVDYAQNIFLFMKKNKLKKNKLLEKEFNNSSEMFSLVHPKRYIFYASRYNQISNLMPPFIKKIANKFLNSNKI